MNMLPPFPLGSESMLPRALLLASTLGLSLACGAAHTQTVHRHTPDETVEVGGLAVVTQWRPTPGRLSARLIFDTGYEDVVPGAVATLAAWRMERDDVQALVLPFRTELSVECHAEQWLSCLRSLAHAVSTNEPMSVEHHASLRRRVRRFAQVARGDSAGRATVLALSAALGSEGQGPFEEGDGDGLSIAALQSYAEANLGLHTALLVLEGDLSGEPDPAIVAAALRTRPGSRSLRHPSFLGSAGLLSEDQVRVETGAQDAMSIALSYAVPETARAVALRLSSDMVGNETVVRLFRARAGAVVLVRTTPVRGARLIEEVAQYRAAAAVWAMSPVENWLAQTTEGPAAGVRIGVGLVCLEREGRDLAACREQYLQSGRPPLRFAGEQTEDIADGELSAEGSRGARLSIRRQPGDAGAVFLWQGGSAEDAPETHGAHAVLALALAQRCGATPIVRPDTFGVSRRLMAAELSRFAACVTEPLSAQEWARAQESAAAFASEIPERSWLAQHAAPSAPGWMIPEGSVQGIADASLGEWTTHARSLSRLRVAIVGDIEVGETVRVLSENLSVLSSRSQNSSAGTVTPAPSEFSLVTEEHDADRSRVVVLWRGPGGTGNVALAADAFASAAELRLRQEGWSVRWSDGGGDSRASWAAVALDLDDQALDILPRVLATVHIDDQRLSERLAMEQADGTSAVVVAYRLASTGTVRVTPPSVEVVEGLLHAAPGFIIGRRHD